MSSWTTKLFEESGLGAILHSCRDTKILCAQRFVRLFAYGCTFLILAHFLSSLNISDERIGLFMTLTLLGDTVISFLLTAVTDQVGRRKVLAAGALLMSASGAVFAMTDNYWVLVAASVVGVISPSGNEIGPFRAVEESVLAQLTDKEKRSDIFAWYTLFGTAGAALGTLVCGWLVQGLQDPVTGEQTWAYQVVFMMYAALGMAKFLLVMCLGRAVEPEQQQKDHSYEAVNLDADAGSDVSDDDAAPAHQSATRAMPLPQPQPSLLGRIRALFPHISPVSRSILIRLLSMFLLDSFASGMASPSWMTYFFTTIHSLEPSTLGTLFLVTNILAAVSNLFALPLARRLGPLKTMCYTHLPSALFLATIAIPPSGSTLGTGLAMLLLALRSCTSSMDQAPRQAFIAASVLPAERTAVMGVVNVVKTLAQAGGIGTAGVLAGEGLWMANFGGAGLMKVGYDLLMLWMFVRMQDRESGGSSV